MRKRGIRPRQYRAADEGDATGEEDVDMDGDVPKEALRPEEEEEEGPLWTKEDRKLRREGRHGVAEAFSPPRICARPRQRRLAGGWSPNL